MKFNQYQTWSITCSVSVSSFHIHVHQTFVCRCILTLLKLQAVDGHEPAEDGGCGFLDAVDPALVQYICVVS